MARCWLSVCRGLWYFTDTKARHLRPFTASFLAPRFFFAIALSDSDTTNTMSFTVLVLSPSVWAAAHQGGRVGRLVRAAASVTVDPLLLPPRSSRHGGSAY